MRDVGISGWAGQVRLPAAGATAIPNPGVRSVGAIAQLGERVLCKHEVVGSIPSGSTR